MKDLIDQISQHKKGRNMSNEVKIGKAKFGGDFVKRKYWKLKDGESVYRILPPIGDLADDGKWSQFYNVHYGYKNSKGEMRVFQSPLVKNRKTKMVESPDAALERIEKLKAEFEKAKATGNKAAVDRLLDLVAGQKAQYNLDNNHYVNAMDTQGNIGILKLRHRAKVALDVTIAELRSKGTDPLSVENGRFFVFKRSGTGLDTNFKVDVKKKKFTVDGVGEVEQDEIHVLTPEIIKRLGKEAAPLDKLYRRPSSDEVARIVKESDLLTGRSKAIDEIIDSKSDGASNDAGDEGEYESEALSGGNVGRTADELGQRAAAPSTATVTPTASTITQLNTAPLAASPVTPLPVAQTQSLAPTARTTAETVESMSDEDFLASLNG